MPTLTELIDEIKNDPNNSKIIQSYLLDLSYYDSNIEDLNDAEDSAVDLNYYLKALVLVKLAKDKKNIELEKFALEYFNLAIAKDPNNATFLLDKIFCNIRLQRLADIDVDFTYLNALPEPQGTIGLWFVSRKKKLAEIIKNRSQIDALNPAPLSGQAQLNVNPDVCGEQSHPQTDYLPNRP